jgi:hypothetical protein
VPPPARISEDKPKRKLTDAEWEALEAKDAIVRAEKLEAARKARILSGAVNNVSPEEMRAAGYIPDLRWEL